jgi:hypothetical protein
MRVLAPACCCADPIGAHAPLEFEAGWCFRCGHVLDPVIEAGGPVDGWMMLEAAIERTRLEQHERAADRGITPQELAMLEWEPA